MNGKMKFAQIQKLLCLPKESNHSAQIGNILRNCEKSVMNPKMI
jgi:hypothetical protein